MAISLFGWSVSACGNASYFESTNRLEEASVEEASTEEASASEADNRNTQTDEIVVQVAGAVASPGVFHLAQDARVYEAIDCAGGVTEDAYMVELNQAAKVEDGQMIYIYTSKEHEQMAAEVAEEADSRVDLNTADAATLTTLPGIGEAKANQIIAYREEHGRFESPEDIMNIQGIKEGVYNQIKDLVVTR